MGITGAVDRYKARLVFKGFQQVNVAYVYAPVVDFSAVRVAVAGAVRAGYVIHHLDVKTAFLNGKLNSGESIFIRPPEGLDLGLQNGEALKLRKALYGLKEAPKVWNKTWNTAVHSIGFTQLKSDECIYVAIVDGNMIILLLYVDDILVLGPDDVLIERVKERLMKLFKIRDLGRVRSFLQVEFSHCENGMFMSQKTYTRRILERFGMFECKPVSTPMVKANPQPNQTQEG